MTLYCWLTRNSEFQRSVQISESIKKRNKRQDLSYYIHFYQKDGYMINHMTVRHLYIHQSLIHTNTPITFNQSFVFRYFRKMVLVRKRRGGRRHKKLKAIDPFYSGPRKLLVDKFVFTFI